MKEDDLTEKPECFDDEPTTEVIVTPVRYNDFVLSDKDVEMIQSVADKYKISYDCAVNAVLRKALDLYHWHISEVV